MRYRVGCVPIFVCLCLFFAGTSSAQSNLTVKESGIRIEPEAEGIRIYLPVENPSAEALVANVSLELVNPNDKVDSRLVQPEALPQGETVVQVVLPPISAEQQVDAPAVAWYRLRYAIAVEPAGSVAGRTIAGIVSVGDATPKLFGLHVSAPVLAKPGSSGTFLVRAVHAVTLHPIDGVKVQATLDIDSDDGEPLRTNEAITDQRGFATLRYSLPANLQANEIGVTVTGKLGNLSASAEKEVETDSFAELAISTDKFLYQPGQTVHVRALEFDPNHNAAVDKTVIARVTDPDFSPVYTAKASTSRFGVATFDWPTPGNLRLGTYYIDLCEDPCSETRHSRLEVKISRYDLPTFAVSVKPDRAYYLPGQNAEVEVSANYLFGQPVARGHVRVVEETERTWNFREQKWDTKTAAVYEGETNGGGRYVAHLDLASGQDQLRGNDYDRFRDLAFSASFTDPSTGKTEEKRFDVRVTREPIHIYALGIDRNQIQGAPLEFYLSADYADGTPAVCDIDIEWPGTPSTLRTIRAPLPGSVFLKRVRTNRYGIAKVSGLNVPMVGEDSSDFDLTFRARDRKGLTGLQTETVSTGRTAGIRVKADKTLYSPGEPIGVELETSAPATTVVVEALHNFQVIERQLVRLRRGRAFLVFSPDRRFQNEVSIGAYFLGGRDDSSENGVSGFRNVYFPKPQGLDVEVQASKASFKPGEEASATLRISSPDGSVKQGALGVVVVDQAVEERAKEDREYQSGNGFLGVFQGHDQGSEIQGVSLDDLDKLDLSKPLPNGIELLAVALLNNDRSAADIFTSDDDSDRLPTLFRQPIDSVLAPVRAALQSRYKSSARYPANQADLESALAEAGISVAGLRDPWGTPYRASFQVRNEMDVLDFVSAGPDKASGNDDDFTALELAWPYFKPTADAIRRAVEEFHVRTGGFLRDEKSLQAELARRGIDLGSLKDRWGRPYRFEFGVEGSRYTIVVRCAGPDGRFDTDQLSSSDDFTIATASIDYFADLNTRIDAALNEAYNRDHVFPENPEEFEQLLLKAGIHWDQIRDPWGRPYYATFRQQPEYADDVRVENYGTYPGRAEQHMTITPATRQMNFIYLRSASQDGAQGTPDDFTVAAYSRYLAEESAAGPSSASAANRIALSSGTGAISGAVQDEAGGAISGATVSARLEDSGYVATATTDEYGKYTLPDLASGTYTVEFSSRGFQWTEIRQVPVRSSNVTALDAILRVGSESQTVTVTESVPLVETANAMLSDKPSQTGSGPSAHPASTPRLREYFPETLYWQPEVVTDKSGRAQIRFPLADSITTWKLSIIASTEDGTIGTAEKEIRAFQPFFAEHDPPRFLTAGDEIDLPVVLRNYLDRDLSITTDLKPEAWFTSLGPASVKTTVPRDDSANAVFKFRATEPVKEGRQRITANGAETGDAIERKVTVRPNGEERSVTVSQILGDSTGLAIQLPQETMPGSIDATLKIYPNLQSHLLESIQAIRERPYGCAEQIISSAYPSLLLLEYAKNGGSVAAGDLARAQRDVELAYQKLPADVNQDGGVTYWGQGEADAALTAYAMKFMSDASQFIDVEDSAIEKPLLWLVHSAQQENGHWIWRDWLGKEDARQSFLLTAYVARMMASTKLSAQDPQTSALLKKEVALALQKAFAYLEPEVRRVDEPYTVASYGLAALGAGETARAEESAERLLRLEHREGDFSYWSLETNTPFYGWGLAGRVETTALVLELLAKSKVGGNEAADASSRGLLFLLHNEDRFGAWYSTQATVSVLDAIGSLLAAGETTAARDSSRSSGQAAVLVDGKRVASVDFPAANELSAPMYVDIHKFLSGGAHSISIERQPGAPKASAQLVAAYYVPWAQDAAEEKVVRPEKASDALRLDVHYDKSSANVGETINCTVNAERIGFRGYGMMLAEIGLPPGADVDRASLDKAAAGSGWDINSYDVLPDRLIVYLWPRAGGTKFTFTFKPRFGLRAQSTPSTLYDYYNPEARAVVQPVAFEVR